VTIPAVVITGVGVICGAANSADQFRQAVLEGKSGIGQIDLFDVSQFPASIGAQVKGYDPAAYFPKKQYRKLSRTDQFALIAAGEAVTASGLTGYYNPYDVGVCVGGGVGGMLHAEQWLEKRVKDSPATPGLLRTLLPDCTATALSRNFKFCGYQGSITTACSSSATSIGWSADLIRTGRQKAMLCGGADSLAILTFAGFNALKVVDPEPCAPFSLGRQGISLGEGAAFLVLEAEEAAKARGAEILGYILGYALDGEAHHMTAPEPDGSSAARVMADALASAKIDRSQVGWVNAHGTGTPLNDVVESNAIRLMFGERADKVPLVSTKAVTGHCLGAAGSIEAVATILALNAGKIPQTLHFRGRDPECDLDYCHDGSRDTGCSIAMSNSFAFGGNITSLVLGAASFKQEAGQ
jgi:3-oxoacyl-[acyl-carrier-protein] synthase II